MSAATSPTTDRPYALHEADGEDVVSVTPLHGQQRQDGPTLAE